jgi:hypothetical protein
VFKKASLMQRRICPTGKQIAPGAIRICHTSKVTEEGTALNTSSVKTHHSNDARCAIAWHPLNIANGM